MLPRRSILDFDGRCLQGVRPFAQFEVNGDHWHWQPLQSGGPTATAGRGEPLSALRRELQRARAEYGNAGAAIGYFAYDFARQLEPRAFLKAGDPNNILPDARLVFYEDLATYPLSEPDRLHQDAYSIPSFPLIPTDYREAVARVKAYIEAGDIYQANLTRRFEMSNAFTPAALYKRLGEIYPARFAACLEWEDFSIVSNSPERFLQLSGRSLIAQPIKGTIRRGCDAAEDERLIQALRQSAKDRAENVMIVDLLRNDLGRVCDWGSVRVPELWTVQTLPTLHHLVSTVTGTLRSGFDAIDAFHAAFPCGSITGAPKIRAMQIIDELEPVNRGVSMGSIGYFGFNGDMEWNVAIRTVTCRQDSASFHTGGGLVADSVAELEWDELQLKAAALRAVLLASTG